MQQLAAARTALQAENERLKKELEAAKAQAAAAGREAAGSKSGTASLRAALASAQAATKAAEQERDQTRTRLQDLLERFRQTAGSLAGVESERGNLRQELAAMTVRFDTCANSNYDLYELNGEILDRLEHQGFGQALARSEPFTRISRARLENLVDDYRQRATEIRAAARAATVAPTPAPIAAPVR
jgi:chromosome segregation ATPase